METEKGVAVRGALEEFCRCGGRFDPWLVSWLLLPATAETGSLRLPIASCGLKFHNEAVRVALAVGLRLGLDICEPHSCRCGLLVDTCSLHSLTCKQAPGRSSRHHTLNDLVMLRQVSQPSRSQLVWYARWEET